MGPCSLEHPLLKNLVATKKMIRLQKIDMAGPVRYYGECPTKSYSRYEHSLGVCALLQSHGASLIEQVTGLLHDLSHTALSHVGDLVFEHDHKSGKSYQDVTHHEHLGDYAIESLLKEWDILPEQLIPNAHDFPRLEQDLPNLCADRIEYTLHNAIDNTMISRDELSFLLSELRFEKGKWYFLTLTTAQLMGDISLKLCREFWGSKNNVMTYYWVSKAIKKAFEQKFLTVDDLKFGEDEVVVEALKNVLEMIPPHAIQDNIADKIMKPKFRGIDPLVLQGEQIRPLSYWNHDFAQRSLQVKDEMEKRF